MYFRYGVLAELRGETNTEELIKIHGDFYAVLGHTFSSDTGNCYWKNLPALL